MLLDESRHGGSSSVLRPCHPCEIKDWIGSHGWQGRGTDENFDELATTRRSSSRAHI